MNIQTYLEDRYVLEKKLSIGHEKNLSRTVQRFADFAGDLELSELTPTIVNKWLIHCEDQGWSSTTIKNMRSELLSIWRHAADADECDDFKSRRIRKITPVVRCPMAWTAREVESLLEIVKAMRGEFSFGVAHRLYFEATIRAAYDTGLRRGDLFGLSVDAIDPASLTVRTMQRKTQSEHVSKLTTESFMALKRLSEHEEALGLDHYQTPLQWPSKSHQQLYDAWKALRTIAGIRKDGAFQMTRRTAATQVELNQPGAATQFLGHQTPDLARKHYIDKSQLNPIQPPKLE